MPGVGEPLRAYVAAEAAALEATLGVVDDPEAVHRTRVAARRLRSVLGAYSAAVPDSGDLRRELRWLGAVAGGVRQLDVLAGMLAGSPVLAEIARQRAVEAPRARAALAGRRAARVPPALDRLLRAPGWSASSTTEVVPRVLAHERSRVLARVELADRATGPRRTDALHDVRKAAKRLRYAAEVVRADVPGADRLAVPAKQLQQVLGRDRDLAMARAWLAELATRDPVLAGSTAPPAAGDLTGYDSAVAALVRS